jgi:hypothetical protein
MVFKMMMNKKQKNSQKQKFDLRHFGNRSGKNVVEGNRFEIIKAFFIEGKLHAKIYDFQTEKIYFGNLSESTYTLNDLFKNQ